MEYYIGIDLGGTNVKAGVTDSSGKLLSRASVRTLHGEDGVRQCVSEAARLAAENAGVELSGAACLGLASAGSIDPVHGIVEHAYNLDLHNAPLARIVEEAVGLPTVLENDANAAALGEYIAGAGKDAKSLIAVTLGTGVGAGAVFNGKLYTGFNYAGMEAGHMTIYRGGRKCTCGRPGCWEAYASATGLIRSTREAMEDHPESDLWKYAPTLEAVNGQTAFDAAQQSRDPVAKYVLDEYIADLACGIVNLVNLFQPEVLCIGGGISKQGEKLLRPLRDVLDREEFTRDAIRRTHLCTAQLGNDAGVIGAAMAKKARTQQGV